MEGPHSALGAQEERRRGGNGTALEVTTCWGNGEDSAGDAPAQHWLADEFDAQAAAATREDLDALAAAGVSRDFLWMGPARFGVAEIEADGDRTYQPIKGGTNTVIVPADPLPPLSDPACLDWDPGDLIAFRLADPSRWWVRTGAAPFLGFSAVEYAEHFRTPLRLWSSPLAWLRAAGDGAVILDPAIDLRLWLGSVGTIHADGIELGEEIERGLRTVARLPQIRVPRPVSVA
jgi:hypothetical protein